MSNREGEYIVLLEHYSQDIVYESYHTENKLRNLHCNFLSAITLCSVKRSNRNTAVQMTKSVIPTDQYSWKKMLVTIHSQPTYLESPNIEKRLEWNEEYGNMDVDAIFLKEILKEHFSKDVNKEKRLDFAKYKSNLSFDEFIKDYVRVMNDNKGTYEQYDCFLFVFLTFGDEETERLHFSHTVKEKGLKPLEAVIEEVKKQEVTWGKPKIFLVQADDISLIGKRMIPKGPEPEKKKVKIPQDADRLIIKSTIPQAIASKGKPSFLIQAFKKALDENTNQDDLLSLTTTINGNVAALIKESEPEHKRSSDMSVPLVTSTLTNLLKL